MSDSPDWYNEIEPYAAQALDNLMAAKSIRAGYVDRRSIEEVLPSELQDRMRCHFFAGIGGWALALQMSGWPEERRVWTGSCPCQPFSQAGAGTGLADQRHLWPDWFHLICQSRPDDIYGEQVEAAISFGWLDLVRSDLEGIGYAFRCASLPAAGVGARHNRARIFWHAANTERNQQSRRESCGWADGRMGRFIEPFPWDEPWQSALARFRVLDDGLLRRVGATDAARNAIVPQVAARFIQATMYDY